MPEVRPDSEIYINFYDALNKFRLPGEKDRALAARLGIPFPTLTNWKIKRQPYLKHVVKCAQALGITPGELLDASIGKTSIPIEHLNGEEEKAVTEFLKQFRAKTQEPRIVGLHT